MAPRHEVYAGHALRPGYREISQLLICFCQGDIIFFLFYCHDNQHHGGNRYL